MEQKWANKLTKEELELISGTYYPILKKGAMEKVQGQLVALGETLIHFSLANIKLEKGFKVSKGENYKDLPYMVLDYPKIGGEGFEILCRVVFWWGKYIGVQFFLNQTKIHAAKLLETLSTMDEMYVLINENIWSNDIEEDCYLLNSALTENNLETIRLLPYLKIIRVLPIKKPGNLFEEVTGFYQQIFSLLESSTQKGA